jgi:putative glutamine amidotransferase
MTSNPLIGIFGWKTSDGAYGCSLAYLQYANAFGDTRILTPDEPVDDRLDLLIVPGGADVDPARYNAMPHYLTGKPDPIKEYQDTVVLPKYIEIGVPVLGICRGCQSIAVLYGAKLVQHMHHETNIQERSDEVHSIMLRDTEFKRAFIASHENRLPIIHVNSMHHQCVSSHQFPTELEILGMYAGKKHPESIEVFRHRTLPIFGIQYHPEELIKDPLGDYIVQTLIESSNNYEQVETVESNRQKMQI